MLREPLTYFVLLGAALLFATKLFDSRASNVIEVDAEALVEYIRQQSKDFAPGNAEQRLQRATPQALAELSRQYIREEALYREALALGFDKRDYVIRRRLVQRLEQFAQGFASTEVEVTEAGAEAYFSEHNLAYTQAPRFTFTHVFHKDEQDAFDTLAILKAQGVEFSQANQFGERFAYHLNYVQRTDEFVAGHFGSSFTESLLQLAQAHGPSDARWHGPIRSDYGNHLVLLTRFEPARQPSFDDVRDEVMADYRHTLVKQRTEAEVSKIIDRYQIDNTFEPNSRTKE